MATKKIAGSHQWTKDELKSVVKLWETLTTEQIADRLNLSRIQVGYAADVLRKAGVKLPKKHVVGKTLALAKEIAAELN